MAMVTSTPQSNNNNTISEKLSLENKNNLRDVSFSSYLNGAEKTFFLELTNSNQTPSSPNVEPAYVGKKKVQEGEIGVFGAEKYFQGEMDEKKSRIAITTPKHHHEKNEPPINNIACVNPKTIPGTPSVRSESSWNSQSALLTRIPIKQTRRKRNKLYGRNFLSNIGCNCYCKDKNSVDIEEDHVTDQRITKQSIEEDHVTDQRITKHSTKSEVSVRPNRSLSKTWAEEEMNIKKIDEKGIGLNREDMFSFPILAKANPQKEDDDNKNDPTRSSLEVFGSPIAEKGERSLSIERKKPSILSWHTNEEEEIETVESPNGAYNDNESEASSDLFEIESFSTNTNSFLARGTSTCYAPSEASIEWSVVTADYEDTRNPNRMADKNGKDSPVRDGQKRRAGILLGCKSQKAVSVAVDAYRTNYKSIGDPIRNHGLDSFKPAGFGSDRMHAVRSRAPNLLYI